MIPFHRRSRAAAELRYVTEALAQDGLAGDGPFCRRAASALAEHLGSTCVLLTPSCTAALELACLTLDLQPGDEVILPSYAFSSCANAIVLAGGTPVFVDLDPRTMNMDPAAAAAAVTPRTRALMPLHYGGVACDMAPLVALAAAHDLAIIEDAAQALPASDRDRPLGTIGDFGCFSFHSTKNVTCGEGGALCVNNPAWRDRAEIVREKGTNRKAFLAGRVEKYTWLERGSSYLLGELGAAMLLAQLDEIERITAARRALWERYRDRLRPAAAAGHIELAEVPARAVHNGHLFWMRVRDGAVREQLLAALGRVEITAAFHFLPLHRSAAGQRFGRLAGTDRHTSDAAGRLLRLPLFTDLTVAEVDRVCDTVLAFFERAPVGP